MLHRRLLAKKLEKAAKEQETQRQIGEALLKTQLADKEKKIAELQHQVDEERSLRVYWEGVAAKQGAALQKLRGSRPCPGDDLY